jgi:chromosome partitioning protein
VLAATMHIISVMNYKGGVGKTTITANLAAELARRERRVLLLDVDPQTNLTLSFVTPEEWQKKYSETKTIRRWFKSFGYGQLPLDLNELIFTPERVNNKLKEIGATGQIDMIASHLELINIDLELAMELNGSSLKQSKQNFLKVHGRLAQGLKQIKDYDFVLIDCPSNFSIVTKTTIVASKADYLSTLGIDYLISSLNKLISDYNDYVSFDDDAASKRVYPMILGVIFNKEKKMLDIMVLEYKELTAANNISEEDIKNISNSFSNYQYEFRGKQEISFFIKFLTQLKDDLSDDVPKYFEQKRKISFQIPPSNFMSTLTQYADTPQCLRQYLKKFS